MAKASKLTGQLVVQPEISGWSDWTPTGSWTSNCTYTGKRKQDANEVLLKYKISMTGAPGGTSLLTLDLPSDLTLDTSELMAAGMPVGTAYVRDGGTQTYIGIVVLNATSGNQDVFYVTTNSSGVSGAITFAVPFTFGNSDLIEVDLRVAVTEYAGGYRAYGAGMSNLVTPGLVYQSDEIDITAQVTCAQAGFTMRKAFAVVSMDKNGKWWMDYVISSIFTSASVTTVTVAITGVVFRNETGFIQAQCATWGGSVLAPRSYANPNANTISVESSSTTATGVYIFGRALLNAKPSWA